MIIIIINMSRIIISLTQTLAVHFSTSNLIYEWVSFLTPGKHIRSDQGRGTLHLRVPPSIFICAHRFYTTVKGAAVCQEVTIETAITSLLSPCSINAPRHFS